MIYVVDDDSAHLAFIRLALESAGYAVATFARAAEALEHLAVDSPEVILCDVMMPEMDGLEMRAAVRHSDTASQTPFILLSGLSAPDEIVRGIEAGADDYLTKPVHVPLLLAKIRALLARASNRATSLFRGDLATYSFVKILRYCELHSLTGEVEIDAGGVKTTVPFQGGSPRLGDSAPGDDLLAGLLGLSEGSFIIRSRTVDFTELEATSAARGVGSATWVSRNTGGQLGKLSSVAVGKRVFDIQSETTTYPEEQVLTVVMVAGRAILKRGVAIPREADVSEVRALIDTQHKAVEDEILKRLDSLTGRDDEPARTAPEQYYQLFESGFEEYRKGKMDRAIALWEEARKIFPGDSTLEINIRIARAKWTKASAAL